MTNLVKGLQVTFETLDTSLSEIKAEALIDTLADKLTEVEMETLLNSGPKIRRGAY